MIKSIFIYYPQILTVLKNTVNIREYQCSIKKEINIKNGVSPFFQRITPIIDRTSIFTVAPK